uniref:Uncharacterized protein n=1 Tax=Clytia hemisphaerica TaxID=252671 RepID=A0A7M5XKG6_9CNID
NRGKNQQKAGVFRKSENRDKILTANEIFGHTAGKQCAAITVFSVCWTNIRKINVWKDYDLDYILHKGDKVFKDTGINRPLYINKLPAQIMIENCRFDITICRTEQYS